MTNRKNMIELIAQTLAPRLYKLYGQRPEEMGFPIYETQEEVDEHLARQFDPVEYWLGKGREIGSSIIAIMEAGGTTFENVDFDAMCKAAAKERPDVNEDGMVSSVNELVPARS